MNRIRLLVVALLVLALFCGCEKPQPEQPETAPKTETQTDEKTPSEETEEETAPEETEEETAPEETEQKYPDVIECETVEGYPTAESIAVNTPCQVRMTKELGDKDVHAYGLYITVDTGTQVLRSMLLENTTRLPAHNLYLGDVDGDGVQEIVVHSHTGGVGGFGLWYVWVLKLKDNEFYTLFKNFDEFDTGFDSRFLEGYRLEVTNRITDYKLVFDVKESHRKYLEDVGNLPTFELWVDPFYEFIPEDVDNDGISEMVCKQYTCIIDHSDYIGTAHSVLKFNTDTQSFEVIDAWFEPYIEE